MRSTEVTVLTPLKAKKYFLKHSSYVNFDLPDYINFEKLLEKISTYMIGKEIIKLFKNGERPHNYDFVNYVILSNKDGAYSWRPMQIIHPVLYVHLVNLMTEPYNWKKLQKRFAEFNRSSVCCISVPRESIPGESDKSSLVKHWWERIEQESIKKSLDYSYIFITDITDCYGSMYTHVFEWALDEGGKKKVKDRLISGAKANSLGYQIDIAVRNMTFNQTNGIPQGSTLMDFLAEIVLGYADEELSKLIKSEKIKKSDFQLLRYRDDYRIFVNDPNVGHKIMKLLSSVLYSLGLRLNSAKTIENSDIIISSIKEEKLERFFISPSKQNFQKEALRIYQLSKKYPNSGLLAKELSLYYDDLNKLKKDSKHQDFVVLTAILTMIALHSPRAIKWVSSIVSVFLEKIEDKKKIQSLITRIHTRFSKIPNTGLVDVWLQRISAPQKVDIDYVDTLTKVAIGKEKNSSLWNSQWLNKDVVVLINKTKVSKLKERLREETISPVIGRSEVELFKLEYF